MFSPLFYFYHIIPTNLFPNIQRAAFVDPQPAPGEKVSEAAPPLPGSLDIITQGITLDVINAIH